MPRVVVTGLGLMSSIGRDVNQTWTNLISGKSGIKKLQHLMLKTCHVKLQVQFLTI